VVRYGHEVPFDFIVHNKISTISHFRNLNVWHDELAQSDQQQSSSSSIMTNSNATATSAMSSSPGGRQGSTLPACHELDGLTEGQIKLCLLFSVRFLFDIYNWLYVVNKSLSLSSMINEVVLPL
jgi:hypothetical protein